MSTVPSGPIQQPLPDPSGRRRPRWAVLLPILLIVVALGVGLIGGVLIGRQQSSASTVRGFAGGNGSGFGGSSSGGTGGAGGSGSEAGSGTGTGRGFGGGGAVAGTITSISGTTITITTATGSKETVTVPAGTPVSKSVSTTVSGLANGEHITVFGTPSGSGAITAKDVTEGTRAGGFGGRGAQG